MYRCLLLYLLAAVYVDILRAPICFFLLLHSSPDSHWLRRPDFILHVFPPPCRSFFDGGLPGNIPFSFFLPLPRIWLLTMICEITYSRPQSLQLAFPSSSRTLYPSSFAFETWHIATTRLSISFISFQKIDFFSVNSVLNVVASSNHNSVNSSNSKRSAHAKLGRLERPPAACLSKQPPDRLDKLVCGLQLYLLLSSCQWVFHKVRLRTVCRLPQLRPHCCTSGRSDTRSRGNLSGCGAVSR
jgi:hypothetical protein